MGHYAKIENDIVTNVIVATQDFVDNNLQGEWLKTSYNTRKGVHLNNGTPLRKNFASIGFVYDRDNDAFIQPSPHSDWVLNTETFTYEAPQPYPSDGGVYSWDESSSSWLSQENN